MIDNRQHLINLLKGAAFGVLNFVVAIVIGFVLAPYLFDVLGERHYGINAIAAGLVGAFALIDFGIAGAVSRYFTVAYAKGEKQECITIGNTAFFLYIALGIIGFVFIVLTAGGIYIFNPLMEDRLLFFIVVVINGLTFAINFPMKALAGIVYGTLRQELMGMRDLVFRIIAVAVTVAILLAGGRLISLAVAGLIITCVNIIVVAKLVYFVFPDFVFRFALFHKTILYKLFTYGFFTFLTFIANIVKKEGSIFLISAMISIESNALYSLVAIGLTTYFLEITEMIMGNWLISWLTLLDTEADQSLINKTLQFAYKMSTGIATFIAFGLIVWGQDFLLRWGGKHGEEYLTLYPALVLLTLGVWNNQCQAPNTKYLFAVAKHAFVGYASLIGYSVMLVCAAAAIEFGGGVNSVAVCTLISAVAIRGIAVPIYLCRQRKESIVKYYWKISVYMFCAGIACLIPYGISHYLLAPNLPRLFLVGILSTITYFPVFCFIIFDKTEKNKMKEILLSRLRRREKR